MTIHLSDPERDGQRRNRAFLLGSVLLFFLVLFAGMGWKHRVDTVRNGTVSAVADVVNYAIAQARELSPVSPGRARSVILGAQTNLDERMADTKDRAVRSRLSGLSRELKAAMEESGHAYQKDPELYLDLSSIRTGTTGSAMSLSGNTLFVLDATSRVLLSLSIIDRSGQVAGGGDALAGARAIYGLGKRGYVLTGHGIVEVAIEGKTSTPVVSDNEGMWQDPIGISSFAGSLYVLDRGASEIYKYPSIDAGYGSRRRWLNPGVTPDLSDTVGLSVDSDVWVLFKNGIIKRFRQGSPLGFFAHGADQMKEAVSFSVPAGGARVWILDHGGGWVIAFDRETGEYAAQWSSDIMKNATAIAVSEESGKIFLLSGERIYVMSF